MSQAQIKIMTGGAAKNLLAMQNELLPYLRGDLKLAVEALPIEVLALSVPELETQRKPTPNDYFLRKNLWKQIEIARKVPEYEIPIAEVYKGVMSHQGFELVMKTPVRLAWLLIDPIEDLEKMSAQLSLALDRLGNELLTMAITKETAGHFLQALKILLDRVHGPVVQRIDTRNLNINVEKKESDGEPVEELRQLRERIAAKPINPSRTEGT